MFSFFEPQCHILTKIALITLRCQHVISVFVLYFLSNATLTAHGIKCYNRSFQVKQIQKFWNIFNLIFLVCASPLPQDQT